MTGRLQAGPPTFPPRKAIARVGIKQHNGQPRQNLYAMLRCVFLPRAYSYFHKQATMLRKNIIQFDDPTRTPCLHKKRGPARPNQRIDPTHGQFCVRRLKAPRILMTYRLRALASDLEDIIFKSQRLRRDDLHKNRAEVTISDSCCTYHNRCRKTTLDMTDPIHGSGLQQV